MFHHFDKPSKGIRIGEFIVCIHKIYIFADGHIKTMITRGTLTKVRLGNYKNAVVLHAILG